MRHRSLRVAARGDRGPWRGLLGSQKTGLQQKDNGRRDAKDSLLASPNGTPEAKSFPGVLAAVLSRKFLLCPLGFQAEPGHRDTVSPYRAAPTRGCQFRSRQTHSRGCKGQRLTGPRLSPKHWLGTHKELEDTQIPVLESPPHWLGGGKSALRGSPARLRAPLPGSQCAEQASWARDVGAPLFRDGQTRRPTVPSPRRAGSEIPTQKAVGLRGSVPRAQHEGRGGTVRAAEFPSAQGPEITSQFLELSSFRLS